MARYADIVAVRDALYEADAITMKGVRILNQFPTISPDDVRGVVHCRECDLWNRWDSAGRESLGNLTCSCAHWTVEDGAVIRTKPTDFCSYGERMVSEDA